MNVEISGELDVVKKTENFQLFGPVSIVRGTYTFYGRRFDVDQGTVTFQGGAELNPLLSLSLLYSFRGIEREKNQLMLTINGSLRDPSLSFSLNGAAIEEANALSYILFGRGIDVLTHGEKQQVAQQSEGGAVGKLIAGQLSAQLSRRLGQRFDLDMIEFKGSADLREAAIVLGKYLTENLFVSYQRQFSSGRPAEVVPEQIALEYELMRHLFLQATKGDDRSTGFDLIWKWDSP